MTKGGNFSLRMDNVICHRLEAIKPGFLKKDVYRYAQENKIPLETLKSFTGDELLKLDTARLFALPQSQKSILQQAKEATKRHPGKYNRSQIFRRIQRQQSLVIL